MFPFASLLYLLALMSHDKEQLFKKNWDFSEVFELFFLLYYLKFNWGYVYPTSSSHECFNLFISTLLGISITVKKLNIDQVLIWVIAKSVIILFTFIYPNDKLELFFF